MNNSKTLKWCHTNDPECKTYKMFFEKSEIEYVNYSTSNKYRYVKFCDGSLDVLPVDTKIQIEKRK